MRNNWLTRSFILWVCGAMMIGQPLSAKQKQDNSVCYVAEYGGIKRLFVDGKPTLLIAGETRNSSTSTDYVLTKDIITMKAMGLDAVLAPVTWEQLEPEEG
ncbi:MAG: hypothetical protein PUE11_09655, partial [Paraprevotella sp.]|nr:hypothetical protein [Paraprevotella sp.]